MRYGIIFPSQIFLRERPGSNASFMLVNALACSLHTFLFVIYLGILPPSRLLDFSLFSVSLHIPIFSLRYPRAEKAYYRCKETKRNVDSLSVSGSRRVVNAMTNLCESVVFLRSTLVIRNYR